MALSFFSVCGCRPKLVLSGRWVVSKNLLPATWCKYARVYVRTCVLKLPTNFVRTKSFVENIYHSSYKQKHIIEIIYPVPYHLRKLSLFSDDIQHAFAYPHSLTSLIMFISSVYLYLSLLFYLSLTQIIQPQTHKKFIPWNSRACAHTISKKINIYWFSSTSIIMYDVWKSLHFLIIHSSPCVHPFCLLML